MVPWFDAVLARSAEHGVRDVVIGGTARGRLNVMANIIKKPLTSLLHEFKGGRAFPDDVKVSSDVPYHFGYVAERMFGDAAVCVTYCNNPSHLEAIDGVALGRVRARQDTFGSREEGWRNVLGLLVHTDAAFVGQGIVGEVLQLSQIESYRTGGTIHFVINNQVGFTTDPHNGRTSIYCTDIARVIGAPVLHVNADDVDAVVRAALIAADYRHNFRADIVVDLVCYRRWGHTEIDEPTFTQPVMYRKIAEHPTVRDRYIACVVADGVMSKDEADAYARECRNELDAAYAGLEGFRLIGWKRSIPHRQRLPAWKARAPDAAARAIAAWRWKHCGASARRSRNRRKAFWSTPKSCASSRSGATRDPLRRTHFLGIRGGAGVRDACL